MPAPKVLVANVFGNGITDILCYKIGTSPLSSASLFLHLSPLPHPASSRIWEMDNSDVPHVRECCVLCLYYMWLYTYIHIHSINPVSASDLQLDIEHVNKLDNREHI